MPRSTQRMLPHDFAITPSVLEVAGYFKEFEPLSDRHRRATHMISDVGRRDVVGL